MTAVSCPFCEIVADSSRELLFSGDGVIAFYDAYPVNPGHVLVIPKRHVGHLSDLTEQEHMALFSAVRDVMSSTGYAGNGDYTIGINDGPLAGQTVPHLHLHIIPRVAGDVEDPRGGVRWVVPSKANYWD